MQNLLIITDVDFWQGGSGNRVRIARLIEYLSGYVNIKVIYTADSPLPKVYTHADITAIGRRKAGSPGYCKDLMKSIFKKRTYKACIIEYVHNSYFLNYIPESVVTILDIHDIQSEKTQSYRAFNLNNSFNPIPREKEYRLFRAFKYILLICDSDFDLLKGVVDERKLIVTPHPPQVMHQEIREKASVIGFVGSEYTPNIDAAQTFLTTVWPNICQEEEVRFHIYGNVRLGLPPSNDPRINFKGFVQDINAIYREVDIIVNPVRFGAGLKIKNVEALGFGLPLLTTAHGARGLEPGINTAFLIADKTEDQVASLINMLTDTNLRKGLSAKAIKLVENLFSPNRCFQRLLEIVS